MNHARGVSDHLATCHRCGNMRKQGIYCTQCPYIFCKNCVVKMEDEHGKDTFINGCPVCCCAVKSIYCMKKYHCYKKCLITRGAMYVGHSRGRKKIIEKQKWR